MVLTSAALIAMLSSRMVTGPTAAHSVAVQVNQRPLWDTESDTWAATDALGRVLPEFNQVGPPRKDRFVGVFYFLWLGSHVNGGPYDITQILKRDPAAMSETNDPNWGPIGAHHHWGQSLFGYYLSDDEYVIRKHAQMLSDAGVDVIIFDASNAWTYPKYYLKLLEVFSKVRAEGGKTPQVAFLCPFAEPTWTVRQLFNELYGTGKYNDLWFKWKGKPLILADPSRLGEHHPDSQQKNAIEVQAGHSLSESFQATAPFDSVGVNVTTYGDSKPDFTLSISQGSPGGSKPLLSRIVTKTEENSWQYLSFPKPLPVGTYTVQMSAPTGKLGWWTDIGQPFFQGQAYADAAPVAGVRSLDIDERVGSGVRLEDFFTYRAPQPDYFQGPTRPDMWSWLEVYPQHVFKNSAGEKEQMSVGVAQNAVNGKLGAMSEPGAHGRSWHDGAEDTSPNAIQQGFNLKEQFDRALKEDPEFTFITGWNEWTAGRFAEFAGVKLPVIFVDEFNEEFSRDIEPMSGGHGDDYYYQMVSFIRRYKGVRPPQAASDPKTVDIGGDFEQWADVGPEFRDDIGDGAQRDHPGWNNVVQYVNHTGRNDFVLMKVARDDNYLYFYAQTKDPISPETDPGWMNMLIKTEVPGQPSWEGYQFLVNRQVFDDAHSSLEQSTGGWSWKSAGMIGYRVVGNQLQLAIPRSALGIGDLSKPFRIEFKWLDNMQRPGDIDELTTDGDVAPNARFNYVYTAPAASH
jgi:hypothetical protein